MFFKLLLRFPTEKYENLIHLTQISFNSKRHSSLFFETPHKVQFHAHTACLVMRKKLREYQTHQHQSLSLFQNLHQDQKLQLHDYVRIRTQKRIIQKESALFYPPVEEKEYRITQIDKSRLPYVYTLDNSEAKRYYAWSLVKLDYHIFKSAQNADNYEAPSNAIKNKEVPKKNVIFIEEILPQTTNTKLRSGKTIVSPFEVTYEITKNGQKEFVDKTTLHLYKKLFSDSILQYANHLRSDPKYATYII